MLVGIGAPQLGFFQKNVFRGAHIKVTDSGKRKRRAFRALNIKIDVYKRHTQEKAQSL